MTAIMADTFLYLLQPAQFMWCLVGVTLGLVVGAIPGLGGGMIMALVLPMTFAMHNLDAQILMIGIYVGGVSGGLISAVLLGVPGAPAAIMSTLDGHAMCNQGKASRALALGIMASFIGGVISWLILVFLSIPLSSVSSMFRNFDYFAFILLGLVLIAFTGSGSPIKALLAGFMGIFVATVGFDQISASTRFTFGIPALANGFHILPVLIGVFAVRQALSDVGSAGVKRELQASPSMREVIGDLKRILKYPVNAIRSSVIGSWIGLLPGIGANIGAVLSYSTAQSFSNEKEKFGHGSEEGLVAAEAGNNATVGGALIPMISLGIPGSGQDVLLMAALILHAVEPGPLLSLEHPEVFYGIIFTYLIANVVMLFIFVALIRLLTKVINVPVHMLAPIVLVFCVVGVIATNNRLEDAWVMFGFGILGFILAKADFPLSPFVIGFVLGPLAEERLRSALMSTDGDFMPLVTRPIALTAIVVASSLVLWSIYSQVRAMRRMSEGT